MSMQFKFCPKCAGALEKKEGNLLLCSSCGFHFYQNPKLCSAVILENNKGEILLVRRFMEPKKGFWDLPGGFVDPDETLEESAIREIKEELGIELPEVRYLSSHYNDYLYEEVNYSCVSGIFTGKFDGEVLVSDGEISEIKFFPKDQIPWDNIGFEAMTLGLKDYLLKNPP